VRQPIYRDGLDQWRNFAPWLGPLEEHLGPVFTAYPAVPADQSPVRNVREWAMAPRGEP
jgi:hypothetical protein